MNILKRNHVVLKGADKAPIIFANGFGCNQSVWRNITPAFEADHEIILFDHVGTGKSDLKTFRPEKYADLEGYANDIISICEELKLKDAIYVGHSVAAMMGIIAAQKAPQHFKCLILIGPSPRHLNDENYNGGLTKTSVDELLAFLESDYEGWADYLGTFIMGNPERPVLAQELIKMFCSVPTSVANVFARATFLSDSRDYLKHVKHPVLIIQTKDDAVVSAESTEFTHREIPNSDLVIMNGNGHCPHMSDPQELIEILKNYIKLQQKKGAMVLDRS